MVVAEIGFARKEDTIMTQVWRSGRPRSRLPSGRFKYHCRCLCLMNFCPFKAVSLGCSPCLYGTASSIYVYIR